MDFEFDPAKSATNLEKHGIDFDAAQALWLDERLLEVPEKTEDEPRFLAIGQISASTGQRFSPIAAQPFGSFRCAAPGNRR